MLDAWFLPFWSALSLILTAGIYLGGFRKIRQSRPALFPPWRLFCFLGGLFFLWMAIASPLNTRNGSLLFIHMTQHLILMSVVPPLLLLGAPSVPLLRGLPRSLVRDGLGPCFRSRFLRKIFHFLTHPIFAWVVMNFFFLAWHVPRAFELALHSPPWHAAEHASFLLTSLLFWFPVIQPWPSVSRGSRWLLLPYLLLADLVNTALAAFLTFSPRFFYPTYAAAAPLFGINPLSDQSAAGALMWVAGSILYLVPLMVITMHLLSPPGRGLLPAERF